jgi:hypothetical protein
MVDLMGHSGGPVKALKLQLTAPVVGSVLLTFKSRTKEMSELSYRNTRNTEKQETRDDEKIE